LNKVKENGLLRLPINMGFTNYFPMLMTLFWLWRLALINSYS
jgi:hypothetical protein